MPLFRQSEAKGRSEHEKRVVKKRKCKFKGSEHNFTLARLCLLSIAENMNDLWVHDYAQNYMDQYFFRYIMGPFSQLPSDLLEELLALLASRKLVTRAALHLMLVPQLRHLSLGRCSGLITSNLCAIIGARCQSLLSLDLSGAVSVSSPILHELLSSLASLRSLTLAGCLCDSRVLQALPTQCPSLRHLDVSRCHHLSPISLLVLSPKHPQSPGLLPLRSLLALDIGFGEWEEDRRATAAFLLLSLPWLERVALEGLGEACALLREGGFHQLEDFISRTGMPDIRELWRERASGDSVAAGMAKVEEESFSLSEATNGSLWCQDSEEEDEGESNGIEGVCHDFTGVMALENTADDETQKPKQDGRLTLHLKHVQGVTFGTLAALGKLCPNLSFLTLDFSEEEEEAVSGSHVAKELERWSTSLRNLVLRFPGPLSEMARGVASVGTSLTSLMLEGVQADGLAPFLQLLHSCPQLTTLIILMEPPRMYLEEEDEEEEGDGEERDEDLQALPGIPLLTCLTLNFTFDQRQKRTPMSWRSLKGALWALLRGAPLLERVSLVAVPCPLDPVFGRVLDHPAVPMRASQSPALRHLRDLNLAHTDVSMATVSRLVAMDIPLSTLDLTGCWNVTLHNVQRLGAKRRRHKLHITWT